MTETPLRDLLCVKAVDTDRVLRSLGTLGGGNHFIEVDRGSDGSLYLVIHSGSRSLGAAIANHYRDEAYKYHLKKARKAHRAESRDRMELETDRYDITRFGVDAYGDDANGHRSPITKATRRDERGRLPVKWETATCEGQLYEDYLHDLGIAVAFAEENRRRIAEEICAGMDFTVKERFSCVHNYIDSDRILRKGAISARLGERVFIPLNMRDGALIGTGLGDPDWNFSAPHGAGRACSRTDARHAYDLEAYQATMREAGVYTTTATKETLDECPMAYKSPDRILPYLADCVEVTDRLTPIYNFKASE
jgi:RNA-splicing ligase RtcB